MFKVITDNPVAYESPDHIVPTGTRQDNTTNHAYIAEVEKHFGNFGKRLNVMDIGCAGGQLIVDFYNRGHNAIGIEGSDYDIKHKLYNWPEYHKSVLWTADITKPFKVVDECNNQVKFDLISAWEVVEHIHMNDLNALFENILGHLSEDGIFVASINAQSHIVRDENGKIVFLHQSAFPKEFWYTHLLNQYNVVDYPFQNKVRICDDSFYIGMKK